MTNTLDQFLMKLARNQNGNGKGKNDGQILSEGADLLKALLIGKDKQRKLTYVEIANVMHLRDSSRSTQEWVAYLGHLRLSLEYQISNPKGGILYLEKMGGGEIMVGYSSPR